MFLTRLSPLKPKNIVRTLVLHGRCAQLLGTSNSSRIVTSLPHLVVCNRKQTTFIYHSVDVRSTPTKDDFSCPWRYNYIPPQNTILLTQILTWELKCILKVPFWTLTCSHVTLFFLKPQTSRVLCGKLVFCDVQILIQDIT